MDLFTVGFWGILCICLTKVHFLSRVHFSLYWQGFWIGLILEQIYIHEHDEQVIIQIFSQTEEDVYGSYSRLLLKYFSAEAAMTGHSLLLASADQDPQQIIKVLYLNIYMKIIFLNYGIFTMFKHVFFISFMSHHIIGIWNAACILTGAPWTNTRWSRWCDEGKLTWTVRKHENSLAISAFTCQSGA